MQNVPPTTRDLLLALWNHMPSGKMSAKKWTRWFQETAGKLMTKGVQHFGCCGRGEGWDPEYMVDATVCENRPDAEPDDPFGYSRLLLAVETEWSTRAWNREYDFCKLADIRAVRKLFACEVSKKVWKEIDDRLVNRFSRFWQQHEMVQLGEEAGLMISSAELVGAWVLRKGAPTERVDLQVV